MNKYFQFFIVILLFSSCTQKEVKQETIENLPKDLVSQIIFEDFKTYGAFREKLEKLYCEESSLKGNQYGSLLRKEHIFIFTTDFCDYNMEFCIRSKNLFRIYTDSIKTGGETIKCNFSISEEFTRQYTNYGKDPSRADSPHKLLVEIMLPKKENINTLKKILHELIISFKKLNLEAEIKELTQKTLWKFSPPPQTLEEKYQRYRIDAPNLNIWFRLYEDLLEPLTKKEIEKLRKEIEEINKEL